MKKLLAVFCAVGLLSCVAFAGDGTKGEINLKVGAQLQQTLDAEGPMSPETGFSIGAEYLYPVADKVKVGLGAEYLFKRDVDFRPARFNNDPTPKFDIFPIYATVQASPFNGTPEVFVKANLGYSFNSLSNSDGVSIDDGFMWALSTGYEFSSNVLVEAQYRMHYTKLKSDENIDTRYSAFGINIGYKFKL